MYPAPHPPPSHPRLSYSHGICASCSVSHSHSVGASVPCMRWVTQAAALGIPVQLIILHPGDTAHCKLGHQMMQAR